VIAAIKDAILNVFNNISYASFCKEMYGMTFTPASKDDNMEHTLTLTTISFLKRTFVYSPLLSRWTMPLEMKSIIRSVCYFIPSKHVGVEQQMLETCVSACTEYFFHCTCIAQYTAFVAQCTRALLRLGFMPMTLNKHLPAYDVLLDKFRADAHKPLLDSTVY
jgi:endoglucanase Acf2